MEDRWWNEWKEYKEKDVERTASEILYANKKAEMQQHIKMMEMVQQFRKEAEETEARRAPQEAMDKFLGGAPYEEVLDLIKATYPERFI